MKSFKLFSCIVGITTLFIAAHLCMAEDEGADPVAQAKARKTQRGLCGLNPPPPEAELTITNYELKIGRSVEPPIHADKRGPRFSGRESGLIVKIGTCRICTKREIIR